MEKIKQTEASAEKQLNFSQVTPCGENCAVCQYKINGDCRGCLETDGRCVKMWEKECYVFQCCKKHSVPFCGLCGELPCQWLLEKGSWNPDIVAHQQSLAEIYLERKNGHD